MLAEEPEFQMPPSEAEPGTATHDLESPGAPIFGTDGVVSSRYSGGQQSQP